jgi:biopolymer transport protein ExbB
MKSYLEIYVLNGGPLMVLLLVCSVALVAAVVQAMIRLRPSRVMPPDLGERARAATDLRDRIALAQRVRGENSPLARALWMTLKEIDLRGDSRPTERRLDPIVLEAGAHVADDLYEDISSFATIYTIAPLLGLMGTILGMMSAFREFALREQKDLETISSGIQEALVTTLWGLGIAIAAYTAAHFFQAKIRRYERERLPQRLKELVAFIFLAGADSRRAASPTAAPPAPTAGEESVAP